MSDAARDVVLRLGLEQKKAKLEPPDTTAAKEALEEIQRKAKEALEDAAKAAEEATRAGLEAADKFKATGDGLFTLARGIAFVSASSSESFEEMMRTVAKVQGVFDIFRGGVDTIKNLYEATQALQAATKTATVADAVHATVIAAKAKAAAGAAAALTAMNAAMGPVGWAIAAVGAALIAAAAAWRYFTDEVDRSAEAQKAAERAADKFKARLTAVQREMETAKQTGREIRGFLEGDELRGALDDELARVQKQKRLAEEGVQGTGGRVKQEFARQVVDYARQELELKKQIRAEQEKAGQEKIKELEAQKASLKTAEQQLKLEENRLKTLEEILGGMSEEEYQRAKKLRERVEANTASQAELDEFAQLTGALGAGIVSQRRRELGRQRGINDWAGSVQPGGGPLQGAGSLVEKYREELRKIGEAVKITEAIKQIREAVASRDETLKEELIGLVGSIKESEDRLTALDKKAASEKSLYTEPG